MNRILIFGCLFSLALGHGQHEHHDHHSGTTADRYDLKIWLEALFATAIVGAAPILVLFLIPLNAEKLQEQQSSLRVFLSFAAGGLLGDSFLHLLPHSISYDHHDHHQEEHHHTIGDLRQWLWTLAGIVGFLMLEKFVRAQTGHHHSHAPHKKDDDYHKQGKKRKQTAPKTVHQPTIAAAGYLNLAADFSHNFTDGLAIGATFLQGTGWTTMLAMLLHEVPHEIGDFAILLQSGFTRRQAMWSQLWTAIGAMLGTVLGLIMESAGEEKAAWITPFTAGGFIYIACTSVFPELLEENSLTQSLLQCIAMLFGIALMVLIALFE